MYEQSVNTVTIHCISYSSGGKYDNCKGDVQILYFPRFLEVDFYKYLKYVNKKLKSNTFKTKSNIKSMSLTVTKNVMMINYSTIISKFDI